MMTNFRIEALRDDYVIVKADSKRFGKQEIMFEGNTFTQCFDYIKNETGKDTLQLRSYFIYEPIRDREGKCFPCIMEVAN